MIYSKNEYNGIEENISVPIKNINNNDSSNMSENSKIDNIKHYDSPDENNGKNIDEISSPDIRAFPKKNNVVNKLQRCKTLAAKDNISKRNNLTFINKKYTEKSYSINSKS